jgi:LPS sulfotransferase NodH
LLQRIKESLGARPPSPFFSRDFGGRRPQKRYLIATTGRSGSTLLCKRIADHGVLGFPMEFLNESYIGEFDRLFPNPNLDDYCNYVTGAFTSTSHVFGLKTDWWRFRIAREEGLVDELLGEIDLIVHLRRRDFVAQAVSLSLAIETGIWHNRDIGAERLDEGHASTTYDAEAIKRHARNILNQEFHWRRFIETAGVPCMELIYEDIVGDVDAVVRQVAEGLDVSIQASPPASDAVRPTRSEASKSFQRRFHEECEDFVAFWNEYRGVISAE